MPLNLKATDVTAAAGMSVVCDQKGPVEPLRNDRDRHIDHREGDDGGDQVGLDECRRKPRAESNIDDRLDKGHDDRHNL